MTERPAARQVYLSDWMRIDQDMIDQFADLTEDWNAIHVDEDAARAAGLPAPIAHGFLVLSMLAPMFADCGHPLSGRDGSLNYGFDRLRFIAPVPAGSRVRARFEAAETIVTDKGERAAMDVIVECEGGAGPALAARWILFVPKE